MTDATITFVGAGPGDRDLVTLAAEDALRAADVVVAGRALAALVTELAPTARVELVDDDVASEPMLALATPGARVVRLYVGDPWLHPAYEDERAKAEASGARIEVIGGVTSELALLAAAGLPLHVRQIAVAATIADASTIRRLPPPTRNETLVLRTDDPRRAARDVFAAHPDTIELPTAVVLPASSTGGTPCVERGTLRQLCFGAGPSESDGGRDPHTSPAPAGWSTGRGSLLVIGAIAAAGGEPVARHAVESQVATHAPAITDGIHVIGLLGGRPVGAEAEHALRSATLVVGGADQLDAVTDLLAPTTRTATIAGGLDALDDVAEHDGPVAVLASGDPGFHGIGRALARRFGADRLTVHPAPSSVALAFARLGLPWDGAVVRSAHTGDADRAAAEVAGAPSGAVLCGPDAPPEAVAAALLRHGARHRVAAVATRLAEAGESVVVADLRTIAAGTHDHRSVLVVAEPEPAASATARPGGRPVAEFAHRAGMITKPEVRSVVLGKLDLPDSGVLWDVGAGSGSVAIEAALAAPGLRAIAVERRADDADRIIANSAALGAVVEVVVGAAPAALAALPPPDRVFVGGGGIDALDGAWDALAPGGRLVATFAAVDRAAEAHRRLGSLVQIGVDRAETLPDGGVRFAADNPVFVAWGDKPSEEPVGAGAPTVVVGVGCSTAATTTEVRSAITAVLTTTYRAHDQPAMGTSRAQTGVGAVATIDRRSEHAAIVDAAAEVDASIVSFPAALLDTVAVPNPSDAPADAVGTRSVAEAAALLAAGPGARLVVSKQKHATVTVAVAASAPRWQQDGRVTVVGLGPGDAAHRTPAAVAAVREADAIVGYRAYVDAIGDLLRPGQRVIGLDMGQEADRAEAALALGRAGWRVAVVSSGDPGVFGMASTVLEAGPGDVEIRIVPGVTAAHAGAAAIGAPLAGAHAVVSLSDLLVPWSTIEAQLRAVAGAGLPVALYNPRSKGRPDHLDRACSVLLDVLPADTPCAVVTAAGTPDETATTATLGTLDVSQAGMRSVVLIGTIATAPVGPHLLTHRHHPPSDGGVG